jgi:hypothetical protein
MGSCCLRQTRSKVTGIENPDVHEKVRKILKDHAGYVLVTCRPTDKRGKMEVELSFEGDPDLASYLVDGAQGYFENEEQLGEA